MITCDTCGENFQSGDQCCDVCFDCLDSGREAIRLLAKVYEYATKMTPLPVERIKELLVKTDRICVCGELTKIDPHDKKWMECGGCGERYFSGW